MSPSATQRIEPHPRLSAFTEHILRAQAAKVPRRQLVDEILAALADLIVDGAWLPASARVGSPDHYTQHLLYVADDRSFSVVALVWDPGQCTPIHDHVTWCVVGVLEGRESQTRYRLMSDSGGRYLAECGREGAPRGHCSALVPPDENIHRVTNEGDVRAISIHVYGADIEKLGTSINQRFDDLPIRAASGRAGATHPWRDEHAQA